jgi:hypothetical protein
VTAHTFDPDSTGRTPTTPPRRPAGRVSVSQPSRDSRDAETAPDAAGGRTGVRDAERIPGQTEIPLIHMQPTLWSL